MVRKITYLCFLLGLALSCQDEPKITEVQEDFQLKVFGGSSVGSIANDCCNAVLADEENIYLTGSINYLNGPDLFVIKTDKYGNEIEWSPILYGTQGIETGNSLSIGNDKSIVAAGYTQASGPESSDFYVVKTSSTGEKIWEKRFGGSKEDKAFAVKVTPQNNIYVAGYTESVTAEEKRQGWVMELSANGDSLWSHDYGIVNAADELRGITEMKDSLLLVGTTQTLFGNFSNDVFLFILKKSTKGIENSATLYRAGNETGIAAVFTSSGYIFVLGNSQINGNVNNIILWKLNANLQIVKEKIISASNSETSSAIISKNGSLTIIGTAVNELLNENLLAYIIDEDLNIVSRNIYGTTGKGNQRGMAGAIQGNSLIIGGCTVSGNSSKASIFKASKIIP
jgi:hypothetical protein